MLALNRVVCLRLAPALLAVLAAVGCGRSPDFSFIRPSDTSVQIAKTHALKVLIGGRADIVWVIDNSGSMRPYQQRVASNANVFMQGFAEAARGFDWRMGLLSTDVANAPYVGFDPANRLDGRSPDPVGQFMAAVQRLGLIGGDEKSYDPIVKAFTNHPDFVRRSSRLFLILVSDEPEQSRMSTNDFLAYLTTLKGDLANVVTYGIFNDETCTDRTFPQSKYADFINRTNGRRFPICSDNYGPILAGIGKDIGERFSAPRIKLPTRPYLESLRILYQGTTLKPGTKESGGFWIYDYETNSVEFTDLSFAPADNETVDIEYRTEP